MQGHRRFLANDRGTVSATARPALSGFGLQWAWRRFYQIALSPGPLQVAASRVLAWSQLARKKTGCLVRAQAVLPKRLMNTPRKPFTGTEPGRPAHFSAEKCFELSKARALPSSVSLYPAYWNSATKLAETRTIRIRPPAQSAYSPSGIPPSVRCWIEFIATH